MRRQQRLLLIGVLASWRFFGAESRQRIFIYPTPAWTLSTAATTWRYFIYTYDPMAPALAYHQCNAITGTWEAQLSTHLVAAREVHFRLNLM